jgi:phage-related tail fiber protein
MTETDQIYSLPTTIGMAKEAYAKATNQVVQITHMAIGDGAGALVLPTAGDTALRREVYRAPLNQLYQHQDNPQWLVAELIVPAEVGGWTIRELGLYDADGDLVYVGNHAEQYKPVQSQGSDETKTIRMVILVSATSAVTLKTDPSVVLASRKWVSDNFFALAPNALVGQAPFKDATGLAWRYPYQTNAQRKAVSTALAAKAGHAYHLTTSAPVTLPAAAGLVVGDSIRFTKALAVEQVLISAAAGETVTHGTTTDSGFYFDINAEVIVVWNGAGWEV